MLVTCSDLKRRNLTNSQCTNGAERNRRRIAEEELWESLERAFQAYGEPLETVTSFKYLVWVLTAGDDNWPSVAGKLSKSRKSWMRMMRILRREGAEP